MLRVSIITVSYNALETIEDTILSVLGQKYDNIEYIIIDGGSDDGTLDILKKYENRIDIMISEPDSGIYDAMNKGISLSSGQTIGILNADDFYYDENVIQNVVDTFSKSKAQLVYGDLVYVKREQTSSILRYWKSGNFSNRKMLFGWMPPHPTLFVQKSVYSQFGLFNLSLRSAADYEFILRVMFKTNITVAYISRVLTIMRDGGVSNSSLKSRLNANNEDKLAWKINNIKPYFCTLIFKPLRKLNQFFRTPRNFKIPKY